MICTPKKSIIAETTLLFLYCLEFIELYQSESYTLLDEKGAALDKSGKLLF